MRKLLQRLLLSMLLLAVWSPLIWLATVAVRNEGEFYQGNLQLLPNLVDLNIFFKLLSSSTRHRQALANSLTVSTTVAILGTLLGVLVALYFRSPSFPTAKKNLWIALLAARFLPVATLVPGIYWFLASTDLLDTLLGLIVVNLVSALSFTVLVLAPIVAYIPQNHLDQAAMEGASRWQTVQLVVIPRIRNTILIIALLNFTFAWNEYLLASFFTETSASQPLSVLVASGVGQHQIEYNFLSAGGLISVVPGVLAVITIAALRIAQRSWKPLAEES